MAFSAGELANIANAALDFYIKGPAFAQTIQKRPLLDAMLKAKKTFPGGKGNISLPVKGDYTTALEGYTHNDSVSYANPANLKRAVFPWKELHAGISLTLTELKIDGISVTDTTTGKGTSNHSSRELTALTGLLEDKLDDMAEGWARSFDAMLHKDGSQDAKQVPGIKAFITDDPTTGTVAGLDRSTVTWWRNRSKVGGSKITASAANQTLTKTLRSELRQIQRFGGRPNLVICGSDFINALELEVAEKGIYTQQGFTKAGSTDIGLAQISMMGLGDFIYDPTLDDLSESKRCYMIDTRHTKLWVMDGEDMKQHNPARPEDKYVLYRAVTWTGGLACDQMNANAVYEVA
ncbi:protein of unknown function [Magnetospirillum sp. XM-1]|uniref:phage major capsid protein n=1 Tax=Magnetospirillum sp. XM-1 TaxID=1663591 RepID=UPI00073DE99F|nr:phage major capsid protein [Magnetospirillum sp. XM-1]CUW38791.1 protein of unknown function [Magnetospirillum sp. XM-1]